MPQLPSPLKSAFPNFVPGRYRLPPDFKLWPEAFVPQLKSANMPATPTVPPAVATGDIITSIHENAVSSAINDLWVNEQWLAANALIDPTTATGQILVRGPGGVVGLPVGTDGQILTFDPAQQNAMKWATNNAAPVTRQIIAGAGMTGGGNLSADVTLNAKVTSVCGRVGDVVLTAADISGAGGVPASRILTAGVGLSGGGDLSADRAFSVLDDSTTQRVIVSKNGVAVGTRREVNFIEGGNIILTLAENSGNNRVDVTIAGTESGGGGSVASVFGRTGAVVAAAGDYTAAMVTNALSATGSYADPAWITSLAGLKVTGVIAPANLGTGIPSASVYLRGDGVWAAVNVGSPQTPWTSDIDAAGFRLLNTGNVGIGTTSPGVRLTVTGPSQGTTPAGTAGIAQITTGTGLDNDDKLQIGVLDGAYSWIQAVKAGVAYRSLALNALGGNVGIGTTSPAVMLEVASSGQPIVGWFATSGLSGNQRGALLWDGGAALGVGGWVFQKRTDAGAFSSNSVVILNSGKVGIGGSVPQTALQVSQSLSGALGPVITLDNSNGQLHDAGAIQFFDASVRGELRFSVESSPYGADLIYFGGAAGATEVFRATSAGNFGIGLPGPQAPLHIFNGNGGGASGLPMLLLSTTYTATAGSGCSLRFVDSALHPLGEIRSITESSNQVGLSFSVWSAGAVERVKIAASGTYNAVLLTLGPSTSGINSGGISLIQSTAGEQLIFGGLDNNYLWIQAVRPGVGVRSLVLNPNSGGVGIGKTPAYALDVAGDVNCTGVYRVNGTPVSGGSGITTQTVATASRAFNTVYQNTTGKPMFVWISATCPNNWGFMAYTDSTTNPSTVVGSSTNLAGTGATMTLGISFWVLPGNYYKATNGTGVTLDRWTEWY